MYYFHLIKFWNGNLFTNWDGFSSLFARTQEERDNQLRRQRELQERRQRAENLAGSLENERNAMLDRYESLQARVHALSSTLEQIQTQAHDIQGRVDSESSQNRTETVSSLADASTTDTDGSQRQNTSLAGTHSSSGSPLRATASSSMRNSWSCQGITPPRETNANVQSRSSPRWGYRSTQATTPDQPPDRPVNRTDALEDSLQSLESQFSLSPSGSPRNSARRDHYPSSN